jgi:uncharacterized protein (TIGR00251 family)
MPEWLSAAADGTIVSLHIQPRASKNEIIGMQGEALKVRLTSPPVEGAANKLCCEFIAKLCGVAKLDVSIQSGEKSRQKRLLIFGVKSDAVQSALEGAIKRK